MKPHIERAHTYWKEVIVPGDTVIDATLGNGYDTLFLAKLLKGQGMLIGYDIQPQALIQTDLLLKTLPTKELSTIYLKQASHASFSEKKAALIVYNLGYLPRGDKSITTLLDTTLRSVHHALSIAEKALSITCYPGHLEGKREEEALLELVKSLPSSEWTVCYHQWLNRESAPSLLWLQKIQKPSAP